MLILEQVLNIWYKKEKLRRIHVSVKGWSQDMGVNASHDLGGQESFTSGPLFLALRNGMSGPLSWVVCKGSCWG